ncbi:ABC transporter permease [Paenibacillus harenae]|uniref:ABC transport system permease protein n=1 Tax=Paenibacillus harenae TaxID=306543 RepID=A0ABT9TUZ8_PAEHA|nr:ABC transporter permease [Paenibacillus harenae]MDQ0111186.1 putative ABC transport system permease protein [Paenibacillus harenae]
MNFRQFAFNNVFRKKRTYAAHFMSSAFSVMVFFIYAVLLYHPDFQGQLASSSDTASYLGGMGLKVSQYLIFIFSFLFLLYSTSAFLKVRKREFGILLILGMSEKQRKKLTFIENMVIGLASVVCGILVGLLFTKLILMVSSRMLMLEKSLDFYVPIEAIWTTAGAFALLFLFISLLTMRIGKRNQVLDLIKEGEKPKPEPKASLWLSLLAIVLILAGYGMVFYFVLGKAFYFPLLISAVGSVILGTYFLFTQLSVYAIRAMKKREKFFFRRINLLTLSDLTYRMKDNAIMFFMVATVMAVAFSGIGVCLAIGDPVRSEKMNPYAITYRSLHDNKMEQEHIKTFDEKLSSGGFAFEKVAVAHRYTNAGGMIIRLSDFNKLATMLGYEAESLSNTEASVASGIASRSSGSYDDDQLLESAREWSGAEMTIKNRFNQLISTEYGDTLIVPDELFNTIPKSQFEQENNISEKVYYYVVPDWSDTLSISRGFEELIPPQSENGEYYYNLLVMDWYHDKQLNAILFIISVLVGVVFFTFAASFIYFRLYADLDRDERQYQMISKLGLSRKELKRLVTRQLVLMFFLPFLMGLIHSVVAFINMENLVQYPMFGNAANIYISFFLIQLVYFFMIRWRYLRHMYQKLA